MHNDDITRLAERVDRFAKNWGFEAAAEDEISEIAAALRTLAQQQGDKPFLAPGLWFPLDILGNPMREFAPGKWETAQWPSEQQGNAGGVAVVGWINEDELPDNYPYDMMFPHSKVDGVRLFPVFAPANPPEAGVTADAEALAMKIYAAHLAEYQHTTLGQQTWDRITEDSRNHWISVAHRLTAALAPQPKDAT